MVYRFLCLLIPLFLFSCNLITKPNTIISRVCITFDDQFANVYTEALPILNAHGFRATCFVNSALLGSPGRLSSQQVLTLYHEQVWEIGGHSLNHENLVDINYSQADYIIGQDYNNLVSLGVNPRSFAIPSGACPSDYFPIIKKYYKNIRGSYNYAMYSPIDRFNLGYLPYQSGWHSSVIKERINRGIADRESIIILGFHKIDEDSGAYGDNCSAETFREILDYISELGLEVVTIHEAVSLSLQLK